MQFLSLNRLIKAFSYSWDGLRAAMKQDPAFQLELLAFIILTPIALLLHIGIASKLLLIGSMMLVLIVELLNTAIEAIVDRISLEQHPLSKKAKDVGSAAVLLSLILAGLVWGVVLLAP